VVVGSSPAAPAIPTHIRTHEEGITHVIQRFRRYLDESWSELKKVSWPTRQQTINLTVLVFVVSLVVGVFISIFDFIFSQGLTLLSGLG
jgi:preprotein translocase subunit SecE